MSSRPYIVHRVSTTQPTGQQVGDEWFDPITNTLSKTLVVNGNTVTSAQVPVTVNNVTTVPALSVTGTTTAGNIQISGSVVASSVNSLNTFGFKNRIINGGMTIDQRNAGSAVLNAGNFTLDRWGDFFLGNGRYTTQQVTLAPPGFINSFQHTVTTAVTPAAGDAYQIFQTIEGYNIADLGFGTAAAQTVTVSFWVRSSITGLYAGSVSNSGFNRSYVFTYNVNSPNTWEFKTAIIPGDTGGTWVTNNGLGITLTFDQGSGSNFNGTAGSWNAFQARRTSSTVNLISTNGATFNITGVQLELGSGATSFDFRSITTEFQLCQRYYQNIGSNFSGVTEGASAFAICVPYWLPMRGAPTVSSRTGYYFNARYLGSDISILNPTLANVTASTYAGVWLQVNSSGLTSGIPVFGRQQNSVANQWSSFNDFLAAVSEP